MVNVEHRILLSFVIPVYNVEQYLKECIDSIVIQMTDECEIILVDDGSTDSSGEICEQYSRKYEGIQLIKKENGGLSSARNAGFEIASGKYVTFIDSDDRISPESIKEIINWINNNDKDLCFMQAMKFYPNGSFEDLGENIIREQLTSGNKEDTVYHLASRPKFPGSAWAKLYRREFLDNNDIHFPYDRRFSEDLGFMLECIRCATSFDVLEMPFYEYRQNRQGSITNKVSMKNFNDLSRFIEESVEKLTCNRVANDKLSEYMMSFVAYEYSVLMLLSNSFTGTDKNEAINILKKYNWTLDFAISPKCKIIAKLCRCLGVKFTASLIFKYRKSIK